MTRVRAVAGSVVLVVAAIAGVALVERPPADRPTATPTGPGAGLAVDGLDGAGIRVGVVDVTGYATGHPELGGSVAATAAFGGTDVDAGGRYTHGTAAAAQVAAVAPGADLYLATATTAGEFRQAVRWLLESGVDVVVAPVSFYGQQGDGRSAVASAAARAADRGVVFVAAAGNLADRHWRGRDRSAGPRLRFGDDERNYLEGSAEDLVLWLSWDRAHAGANFTALLYREDADGTHLVARSRPYGADPAPNERIAATLAPNGRYFVVVSGPNRSTGATVELEAPTHGLEHAVAAGSVTAPATARDVLVVGAYDDERGRVAPYTSRGPTADGRPAVDLVAPATPVVGVAGERHAGSSLSAPYVAGVAALLLAERPGMAPGRVELLLEVTAADVGPPGFDPASGFGLVDARAAARRAGVLPPVNRTTGAG